METRTNTMIKLIKTYSLTVLILINSISFAQHTQRLQFEHIGKKSKLSTASVTSILQDSKGFVWFGTHSGLFRFDGYDVKLFERQTDKSLGPSENMITSMYEDHSGKIWIGLLNNGLSIYDPETNTFSHLAGGSEEQNIPNSSSVFKIMEDKQNQIWIGTDNGFSILNEDRSDYQKVFPEKYNNTDHHDGNIFDIVEDEWNRVWMATGNRTLTVFNKINKKYQQIEYTDLNLSNFEDNDKKNLCIFQDTLLYIGSNNGGLSEYNLLTGKYTTYLAGNGNKGPSSNNIRDIIQVDNELWVATDGKGLNIFDVKNKTFKAYTQDSNLEESLNSDVLWSLYRDRQKNVWLGTYLEGVEKYDSQKNFFRRVSANTCNPQSLPNKPILSIYKDTKGRKWVGTDWGGLHQMTENEDVFIHYDEKGNEIFDSESQEVCKSIAEDKYGNLLIGTYSQGLNVFDIQNNKVRNIKNNEKKSQLPINHVWSILTDQSKNTWIATLGGGIAKYDPDKYQIESIPLKYHQSAQKHIYNIFEDSKRNIWFCTDGGVVVYNSVNDTWDYTLMEDLIAENRGFSYVRAVVEDNFRRIWIATTGGLLMYKPETKSFRVFDSKDNIPELPLLDLTIDSRGNLIFISKKYISKMFLDTFKVVSNYVDNNSFNYGAIIHIDKDEIGIGGTKGITYFNPDNLKENEDVPPVYITDIEVLDNEASSNNKNKLHIESISKKKSIVLDKDQSTINIKFSCINYSETERNKYTYKLEGLDKDWSPVSDARVATYSNLPPGEYTFKVKAANNHNVWNKEGAEVELIVKAPYWQTVWFKMVLFLLSLVFLYFLQKNRASYIRKQYIVDKMKAEREKVEVQNQQLELELKKTKSELENITLNHLHKNQSIQQLQTRLVEISSDMSTTDRRKVKTLVKELNKDSENQEYWDTFEHQFNKSHDNFLERMQEEFPELSKRELRICAYLRMDLANQEIATLMNVSVRTLETARYRIRKKMGIQNRKSLTKIISRY
ncbi:two-component regulator propeller domain-containing protein [Flammeovirga yaeyamensis]|nr:two-component regulator propeller domain-containing protein [Flammeovirga yaeyamensis]